MDRLKRSIQQFGFIVPIITNKDLLIADGEQRWIVANELAMKQVLVVRLPVEDVDRRLLRQVLNKLRGEHELLLDAEEFDKIIAAGKQEDLQFLIDLSDSKLERYLREIHPPTEETFEIPEIDKVQTDIKRGNILQLGKHRIMCGDATSTEDMASLLAGAIPRLVWTDPPYGVAFNKRSFHDESFLRNPEHAGSGFRNWGDIKGDDTIATYLKFLEVIVPLKEGSW